MNKLKKIAIYAVIVGSYSFPARADIDFLSYVQDQLEGHLLSQQLTLMGERVSLQDLKEAVSDRNILKTLKEKGKTFILKSDYIKNIVKEKIFPGLNIGVSNSALGTSIGISAAGKRRTANEVAETTENRKEVNRLMIENTAAEYAKGLVLRRSIQDESEEIAKEDEEEMEDIPVISNSYRKVYLRAMRRWLKLLEASSSQIGMEATQELSLRRLTTEEIEEKEEAIAAAEAAGNGNVLTNIANGTLNGLDIKDISSTINYGVNTYKAAKNGNISGVISNVGGGVGDYLGGNITGTAVGGDTGKTITSIGNSTGSGVSSAVNGNWSGVISSAGNITGTAVGGDTGKTITSMGNSTGTSVNNVANGDYLSGFINIAKGAADVQDANKNKEKK